jgi:CubicO group peptidase (beta-lactamase class C family)
MAGGGMHTARRSVKWVVPIVLTCAVAWPLARTTPIAKPEDVGFSAERLQRINQLVQRHIDAKTFSGAVTLVARQGRIAHFEALGLMDLDAKRPMQKDALFMIMSMTKPVVGAAMLMLIEDGKVRLHDPVSRFIPELKGLKVAVAQPNQGPPPPAGSKPAEPGFYTIPAEREITIRDLLTHTSGLVSGPISISQASKVAVKGQETLADVLPRLTGVPLEFQPGSRYGYSPQAGFDALLRVVEIVSGQKADQFLRQRIFDPLGMKDTRFYPVDGDSRLVTRYLSTPNGLERRPLVNFMNGTYFSGAGGLLSTAEDYLQFALMLMNGGALNGRRLLAPRTVEVMTSVVIPDTLAGRVRGESYGLGVRVLNDPVARNTFLSVGSFGWGGAYGTHFWVDPKEKIVGILMVQTPSPEIRLDFENAVMHALVGGSAGKSTN